AHAAGAVLADDVPELRREDHLVAAVGDRASDELFVLPELGAVDVRRIEEGEAQVERPVDRGDRLLVVDLAVPGRHPHAAEALFRDLESLSERAHVHPSTVPADGPAAPHGYTGRRSWLSPSGKPPNRAATSAVRRT